MLFLYVYSVSINSLYKFKYLLQMQIFTQFRGNTESRLKFIFAAFKTSFYDSHQQRKGYRDNIKFFYLLAVS